MGQEVTLPALHKFCNFKILINMTRQRILSPKHEWKCGRPMRLNSRMKRASNKQCVDTLDALLRDLGV